MNQHSQDELKNFSAVIQELSAVAADITRVEEEKTAAAAERKHELLDGCIQEEQALLLKLRGLEQRRMRLQKALGLDGFTLNQILEEAPQEQAEVLFAPLKELSSRLGRLKEAREASEQIIGVRLHELEAIAARMGGAPYNSDGSTTPPMPRQSIRDTYV